mgnify:CR=1 FL=1
MEKQQYFVDSNIQPGIFELGRGENISVNEVAKMFEIEPTYKDAKPGEARHTLCKSHAAQKLLNWIPQKDLLHYIQTFKNENITNTTLQK